MIISWALPLCLTGVFFLLVLWVVLAGRPSTGRAIGGAFLGMLVGMFFSTFCVKLVNYLGENGPSAGPAATHTAASQGEKRFEDLNFILKGIPPVWKEMDAKAFGDAAYLARNRPKDQMLSVIVEKYSLEMSTAALTEIVRSNATTSGEMLSWTMLEPVELAGIPSSCAMYEMNIGSRKNTFINIHHVDRGFLRQFVLLSKGSVPASTMRAEIIALSKHFSLIDPERRGGIGNPLAASGSTPEWGCSMSAGGEGWSKVEGADGVRGQLWHGSLHGSSHLVVVPIVLPEVEVDATALLRGLLSGSTDRSIPESGLTRKELEIAGATGWEYGYNEKLPELGDYRRLVRVIRRGRMAWLLDGAARADLPQRFEEITAAMDGFKLLPEPAELPRNDPEFYPNFCNQAGLSYYVRGAYSESRALFDEAYRVDPAEPHFFNNVLDALANESKPDEIVKRIGEASASLRDRASTQVRAAAAFAALGRVDEAKGIYQKVFGGGLRDDAALREAADFFTGNGSTKEARELVSAYRAGGTNQQLDLLQARLLSLDGMKKEALEIVEKLHAAAPGNQDILVEFSKALMNADRKDEGLTVLHEAVAGDPENVNLLYQLGYQLADAGKFEEALESLEKAAGISPKDQTIQEELAYVRSRLGRGHDSEVRTALDPVPLPPSLAEPPQWKADAVAPDADRVNLRQVTVYDFKPGTAAGRTIYHDMVLLSTRAVETMSTLRFTFTPLSERVYLNRLEVLDAEGKVIAKADEKDQYVTTEDGDQASGSKVLCVPVPGLVSGSRLRYEVTYRDRSPSSAFSFESGFFFNRYGVEEMAICVKGKPADVVARTSGRIEERSEGDFRIWSVKNVPATPSEGSLPAREHFVPILYLGPSGLDWKKLGDGYLEDIAKQLAVDPDVESLARDIVSKATDDEGKIRMLYRWVQQEFTYKAIEFGTRARIPHPAGVTCANRYGDCKDLSVVLHTMLRAVGIPSRLCLVHTSNRANAELPSMDQFNHMIVHLPAAGGRPMGWLDPTERDHASIEWIGSWLEGRNAFVLEKGASRFEEVADAPFPSPHLVKVERRLEAGEPGMVMVHETVRAEGVAADGFRSYFSSIPAAERVQKFRELVAGFNPGYSLEQLDVRNLQDQNQPLILVLLIKAKDFLATDGSLKRLPVTWERDYLRPTPQDRRVSPFTIPYGWQVHSVTTGSLAFSGKTGTVHKDSKPDWGDWEISSVKAGDGWKIEFNGRLKRRTFLEASTYPAFFDFWETGLLRLAEPWSE